ncbi:MAG TPA: nucleoside transporter C-terminal domain-containing protein [Ignavibacteriaceae bacterium]|nr:nucleoside transporter C-terminal domain-containing protein [Ignavibacteriaceae bacterium]
MNFEAIIRGIIGLIVIIGIAFLLSNNKKRIDWKLVTGGLILQIIFAVLIINGDKLRQYFGPLGWFKDMFNGISWFFVLILDFTTEGSKFVFGNLAVGPGSPGSLGVFFAFQVLPSIIFFASLMSIMYYLGIMQKIVQGMAWVMARVMGTSGAESISCAAEVFVGQTEAPLMIKPYIKGMTQSELLTIMIGGMATIAGGVLMAYIQILAINFSESMHLPMDQAKLFFATHLLGASVMAAPAALLIAKVLFPETGDPETKGRVKVQVEKNASNVIEAAANGASDGLTLALNVGAMLIAFIALIALINYTLESISYFTGLYKIIGRPLSFQLIFGSIFQVLAYAIGVPWQDSLSFGSLLGTKVVLNEFVAYLDLGTMIKAKEIVNEKTIMMATYALCGFANFSSIAIQIGGTGAMAPSRKSDIAKLGIKAVIGGSLATLMTATLAGMLF